MKRIILFILLINSLLILYGCQNKEVQYPIRILAYNEEQYVLEEIVENFKKTYAPIENEISITYINSNEALSKDIDFFDDYDIFAIQTQQLEKIIEKKMIVENTLHSRQVMIYNAGGVAKAADYKGRVFNFPYSASTYLLFYDNTIYNTEDIIELQTMFKKRSNSNIASLGLNLEDPYSILSFYFGAKVQIFPDYNIFKITLDSEQGIEVSKYISKLKGNGVINTNYEEASNLFRNKQMASIIAPVHYAESYKAALGSRFAVSILPIINLEKNNSKFNLHPPVWVYMYTVNNKAKSLNRSSELAYYMTSPPAQYLRFQKNKTQPTVKILSEKKDIKDDKVVSTHLQQLQYAIPPPVSKKLENFWGDFPLLVSNIYDGRVYNIEEKIKELSEKIKNS